MTEETLDNFNVESHHIPSSLIRRMRWQKRDYQLKNLTYTKYHDKGWGLLEFKVKIFREKTVSR